MTFFQTLSIKQKLMGMILIVTMVSIFLGFSFVIFNNISTFKNDLENNAVLNASIVGEYLVAPLEFQDNTGVEQVLSKLQNIPSIRFAQVYDEQGNQIAAFGIIDKDFSIFPPPSGKSSFFEKKHLHIFYPIIFTEKNYGHIYLRISTNELSEKIRNYLIIIGLLTLGLLVLSYFLAARIQGVISKPILSLAAIASEISDRAAYSLRVHTPSSDEIGILYDRFNSMLDQIQSRKIEQDKAEKQIKNSLDEKIIMLQEIHHRVKNNMQIISSLIRLHSRSIHDEKSLQVFEECRDRIQSMALVHEILYKSKDFARIDFGQYLQNLTDYLFKSYSTSPESVKLSISVKRIAIDINNAIPVGMLINELVSNALKHAFPNNKKGEISITLTKDNQGRSHLEVKDNGVGLPEDFDLNSQTTFGVELITTLVRQLNGKIKITSQDGTLIKVTFK